MKIKRSSENLGFRFSDDLVFICGLHPLSFGGRGWLYGLNEFDFTQSHRTTPILTFPGFEFLHSETDGQNTYKVVQKNISRNQRSIVTKNITPSNYFKIRAIGDNNQTESFSILVQLYDDTPPAVPVGLTGKIDSTGIVRLEWKANTEKDLGGYHVFRGVQKGEEMMRLTPEMITQNTFEDKVALENLNSKVYYYVVSLDKRKNQFQPSEIIEKIGRAHV